MLCSYTMVKDHRTDESGNTSAVLDGDIDDFINAYLKWINTNEKSNFKEGNATMDRYLNEARTAM